MPKKLFYSLCLLLVSMLFASIVSAAVRVRGERFDINELGDLTVAMVFSGIGNVDATARLSGSGQAVVSCYNQDGELEPDQGYVLTVNPTTELSVSNSTDFSFQLEAAEVTFQSRCPNSNWSAQIDFIYWTDATINVYDSVTGANLDREEYICLTARYPASVSCVRK